MTSRRVCLLAMTGCRGSSSDGACHAWMSGVCSRWSFPGSCLWSSGQFLHKHFMPSLILQHTLSKKTLFTI